MSETFDPDERFTLDTEPENALRRILAGEGADEADMEPEPETEHQPE